MSPVTEKKPHSHFICKNFDVFVREGGPARLPRFLGNRDENFPRQPGELDETLKKKTFASLSQQCCQNIIILPCMHCHFKCI